MRPNPLPLPRFVGATPGSALPRTDPADTGRPTSRPFPTPEPLHVEMEATNGCNTRCLHCPHEKMSRPRGRMSWATFTSIIANFRQHLQGRPYSLSFSGMGEPLLNPELPRFIAHVAAEARTSFACNGALLTERNVTALIEAGLDSIFVSFNGDERGLFEQMMGGLSFDRGLRHLRRAVELARGTRLEIRANVSVTRQTRPRLTAIRNLLTEAGVEKITYSLAHSRGGNLDDPEVCDTPPSPPELVHCAVIAHTLFVDWRGRVFICDHDLHGEHPLGDLTQEPLGTVLARRQVLIDGGMPFELCRKCDDVLKGGFPLFANNVGGVLSDWIHALYADDGRPSFADATPTQRWMLEIYRRAGRLDRAVDRLLGVERELRQTITYEQDNVERVRRTLMQEVENRDACIAELEARLEAVQATAAWRWRERLRRFDELMANSVRDHAALFSHRVGRFLMRDRTAETQRQLV